MKKPWVFLVALSLVLSVSGCDFMKRLKKEKEKIEAEADSTSALANDVKPGKGRAAAPVPADPDEALGLKLNHPIDCINGASLGVTRSHERYLGWVKDAKAGPTGREQVVYGLYEVQPFEVEKCKKALAALSATPEPPTPELDKTATDYAAKLDAVLPLVAEAHKYYDLKNYQDDGFAKAKAMHGPLIAAFEAFDASATALHEQVGKLKAGLAERELDRIEKSEGKKLSWHQKKFMLLSKSVADLGGVEDAAMDLPKLEAALKALEDEHTTMEAYVKANPGEAKTMFSMFASNGTDFVKVSKELHRRVRDKRPWSTGDLMMLDGNNGWMVEGSQQKMIREYNELVSSSNSLNGAF